MEATLVFLFIILSAAVVLVAVLISRKKPVETEGEENASYAEGLNLLLLGRKEEALDKFRETVKTDSRNLDAYIKIGDILRDLGQPERAISVHKYLTVRTGLSARQRQQILQCLAADYQAAKQYDNAIAVLDQVLARDRHAAWAREMTLGIFEAQEEWTKAFKVCSEIARKNGSTKKSRLALYKVFEGVKCQDEQDQKEAQSRFREAIKIAPGSPPGYIYLADSYKFEQKNSEALKTLKEFVKHAPEQTFLALDRIKELMYEGGVYGEIEGFYQQLLADQPENLALCLALAENFEKKGEHQRAIDTCLEILEKDGDNKSARKFLVRLYHSVGNSEEALRIALELIDDSLRPKDQKEFDLTAYWEGCR